ncbi:MAG: DUF1275 domain-containing protein [Planctomycetaceae bacterium]|jgi:uncharacterized membrane protein YoaK (UPF0700 family)|nr:DUF1275 domain-containing protein [Planctomycetaceae bacterium]
MNWLDRMRIPVVPSTVLQSRLAISLAWIAGYVNLVALMTCGIVTSHMTGHAGALGRSMAEGSYAQARFVAVLLAAFVFGAFLAGFAIEFARSRGWRRVYVLPAAIELSLLVAFGVGVELHDPSAAETGAGLWWMGVIGTLAMGVQNATITRISQGVVRTTHLTGILTDIGHECARLAVFRRMFAQGDGDGASIMPRLALLLTLALSFIAGAVAGTYAFGWFPRWSMVPPVVLLAWIIAQDMRRPIHGPDGLSEETTGTHAG